MVAIKIFFGNECRRANNAPKTLAGLKELIYSITNLKSPVIQYKDEDGDMISIYSELEYQDLLECTPAIIKLIITPSKLDQASETFPVKKGDMSSSAVPSTINESIETRVYTLDKSESTNKPKMEESGCSPQEFVSKNIETLPLFKSSVESGTAEVHTSDKFTKTKNNLLESIRGIIRDEISKGSSLMLSGIQSKHVGVECSHCKIRPIVGIRYKCSECSVNFCETCEFSEEHEHPFYKVRNSESEEVRRADEERKAQEERRAEEEKKAKGAKWGQGESKMHKVINEKLQGNQPFLPPPSASVCGLGGKQLPNIQSVPAQKKPSTTGPTLPQGKVNVDARYMQNLKTITDMGFSHEEGLQALRDNGNNLELAVELLFSKF